MHSKSGKTQAIMLVMLIMIRTIMIKICEIITSAPHSALRQYIFCGPLGFIRQKRHEVANPPPVPFHPSRIRECRYSRCPTTNFNKKKL